jgi:LytS/YehU family sensor histidine kinase
MRYVLYQANEEKVPLASEIAFIRNFVELQRIRYDASAEIELLVDGDPEEKTVAPLLFIDFVENAFKHGLEKRYSNGFVKAQFIIREKELIFTVQNNTSDQDEISFTPKPGGIGLTNVKRRLSLIYADAYTLDITEEKELFNVHLTLSFT